MSFYSSFELVKDGPLRQGTFHVLKGPLTSSQKRIGTPDLIINEISPVASEEIASIQALSS